MISIIISSYQPHYFSALEKNIAETCGVPYEILKIENPGKMGICEAYNIGAEKAKYENLLFVHEDVLFETQNWGEILVDYLQTENIGCIGVAGGDYLPIAPSSWLSSENHSFAFLIQNNKENKPQLINTALDKKNVLMLDGVFLATRKNVFLQNKFSDNYLHSYHGYDIDFSLKIAEKYKNYVINDILIEHFSQGNFDNAWANEIIKVKDNLKTNFQLKRNSTIEYNCYIKFLRIHHSKIDLTIYSFYNTIRFLPLKYLTFRQLLNVKNCYFDIYKKIPFD